MEALEGFSQRLGLYDIGMHMTRKLRLERLVGPWRVLFLHVQRYMERDKKVALGEIIGGAMEGGDMEGVLSSCSKWGVIFIYTHSSHHLKQQYTTSRFSPHSTSNQEHHPIPW